MKPLAWTFGLAVLFATPVARADGEGLTHAGPVGLLHTQHAERSSPLRLALTLDGLSSGSLCTTDHPCKNAATGAPSTGGSLKQLGATLGASFGLVGPLEGYAAMRASTTSDSVPTPATNLSVLGETTLGVRLAAAVSRVVRAGGFAQVDIAGARGFGGFDLGSTGARLGPVVTLDLRPNDVPLRASLEASYTLDNTAHAFADAESQRNAPVTRIERFSLDVARVDRASVSVGAETFLASGAFRPFVEYGLAVPVNRQGYRCDPLKSQEGCLATTSIVPSALTLGARAFPWGSGLSLLAAIDVGVTGTGTFIEEVPPTAPWRLFAGAGYDLGATPAERTASVTVQGVVLDPEGQPVGGAHVRTTAGEERLTDDAGAFAILLAAGDGALAIDAAGFAPGRCEPPKDATNAARAQCTLSPLPGTGTLIVVLREVDTQQPAAGVRVHAVDAGGNEATRATDAAGTARFAARAAGAVHVDTSDDAHLELASSAQVVAGESARVEWPLVHAPSGEAATVTVDASGVHVAKRLEFTVDGAIAPASARTMAEIAHAVLRHPELAKLEIRAFADGAFPADQALSATTDRAERVRAWLVQHGVPEARLSARGMTDEGTPTGAPAPPSTVRVEIPRASPEPSP
jgi:outer membrane protein OmpA-like peptidoglycan-associated protein